jgi:hypothetical protein
MFNVFISWSGERSRMVASAIDELLPDIIQGVHTWMSDHDIGAGSRWAQELNQQLEGSNFGILCLTPENLTAPWLLFEAGALSKKVEESRVIPYRLTLSATDVPFPLAQFQGVDADESGTKKLLLALGAALSAPIEPQRLDRMFQRWWPDLAQRITAINVHPNASEGKRSDRDLLEETLRLVRTFHKSAAASGAAQPERDHPEAFSVTKAPKSAVWKSLHDVTDVDMVRMTDEELEAYRVAVKRRDHLTPHEGEEIALSEKERLVDAEKARRLNLWSSPNDSR